MALLLRLYESQTGKVSARTRHTPLGRREATSTYTKCTRRGGMRAEQITIDGADIATLNVRSLRSAVAVVAQVWCSMH